MKIDLDVNSEQDLAKLHNFLDNLEKNYDSFLDQESVKQEVSMLKNSINECLNGSPEAGKYLAEHAVEILTDVKSKLEAVVMEQTRLQDEMPSADNFTGGKIDRASKAAATAEQAKSTLETIIENQQ